MNKTEFFLNLAADSSKIVKGDKLAKLISEEDELSELDLDEVCAAAKPDIEKLTEILKEKQN